MSDIIQIQHRKLVHGPCGWSVDFTAVVDDIVQVSAATQHGPAQFGSALCEGTILLADDDQLPTTHQEFLELADLVADWQPITNNNY